MSDSRVGGYPMGVTDAAIERHFGGACEPRMCGNCRHFCGSDIHVDYGYCHLEFERAFDAEAPERKEGFWRLDQSSARAPQLLTGCPLPLTQP